MMDGRWELDQEDPSMIVDTTELEHDIGEFGSILATYHPHVCMGIDDAYDGMEEELCFVQNIWPQIIGLVMAVERAVATLDVAENLGDVADALNIYLIPNFNNLRNSVEPKDV
jgi:hypothetical protein